MKKQMKKPKFKIIKDTCFKCGRKIDFDKEDYVVLTSHNRREIIEEVKWHTPCWGRYNSDRFNERLQEMVSSGMGIVKKMGVFA